MDHIPNVRGEALDTLCKGIGLTREGKPFKVRPVFAWYDFWVGAFWDQRKQRLYVMLLPMFGFYMQLSTLESDESLRAKAQFLVGAYGIGS